MKSTKVTPGHPSWVKLPWAVVHTKRPTQILASTFSWWGASTWWMNTEGALLQLTRGNYGAWEAWRCVCTNGSRVKKLRGVAVNFIADKPWYSTLFCSICLTFFFPFFSSLYHSDMLPFLTFFIFYVFLSFLSSISVQSSKSHLLLPSYPFLLILHSFHFLSSFFLCVTTTIATLTPRQFLPWLSLQ